MAAQKGGTMAMAMRARGWIAAALRRPGEAILAQGAPQRAAARLAAALLPRRPAAKA